MKYENCPICDWTLGIPEKLSGHPITCPKCNKAFLPSLETAEDEKPKKKKRRKSEKKRPSAKALPVPAALAQQQEQAPEEEPVTKAAPEQVDAPVEAAPLDSHRPINQSDLNAPTRKKKNRDLAPPPPPPAPAATEATSDTASTVATKTTARIIQAEPIDETLTKDGSLPSLKLKEDKQPVVDVQELKTSPIFLGILVCFSVLSSGFLLFFAVGGDAENAKTLDEARAELAKFYYVRYDMEIEPYQQELRDAQLAHSRNDRAGEVAAYRKIMARFHSENLNPRVGVTGSPSRDRDLKEILSILLGDGNNEP